MFNHRSLFLYKVDIKKMNYYTYILRCEDNTLYTGITNNLERRMEEHFNKTKKCAKYTKHHRPIKIEKVWKSSNRKDASKLEFHIKRLKKQEKELLLKKESNFLLLFDTILDCSLYENMNLIDRIKT